MNCITRYVQAVVNRLPKKDRTDVSEELTSLLEEEAESHFQCTVDQIPDGELKQWIEQKDHPSIAAVAYLPKRNLIEESAYPLYWSTVKTMLIVMAVFWVIPQISYLMFSKSVTTSVVSSLSSYVHMALVGFAIVTLVFHFGSRNLNAHDWYRNWDATKLPNLNANWKHIPYTNSVFNIIFSLFFMAWLTGWMNPNIDLANGSVRTLQPEHLAPEVSHYVVWFYLLLVVSILSSVYNLVYPYWKVTSLLLMGFTSLVVGGMLFRLSFIPNLVDWTQLVNLQNGEGPRLAAHLASVTTVAVRIAAIISIYEFAKSVYRLAKLKD